MEAAHEDTALEHNFPGLIVGLPGVGFIRSRVVLRRQVLLPENVFMMERPEAALL